MNPKSSGVISVEKPGLLLSMNARYNRHKGQVKFDQMNAVETLAESLDQTEKTKGAKPKHLPLSLSMRLPRPEKAEVS